MLRNLFAGVGYLARGFARFGTDPRVMWLGAVPALIVGALYAAVIVVLAVNLDGIVSALTPFADGAPWEPLVRIAAGLALVALSVIVLVSTFAALALAVGGPFYERIADRVSRSLGESASPAPETAPSFRRGLAAGLRLFALSILVGVLVFAAGLIPVVGQTLVPALGALFGAWLLALELTGIAFDARGLTFRDRRHLLGRRRARAIGFGLATYLLLLVPFAAIFVMPAAVAGATLLAHDAAEYPA